MRPVLFAAFLILALHSSANAHPISCERLLLSPAQAAKVFDKEFKASLSDSPGLQKLFVKLRKYFIRSKILKTCVASGGCTRDDVAVAVRDAIENSGIPNAIGYGVLLAGMTANASVSSGILSHLDSELKFVPLMVGSLLGQMSFITVNLFAPFLEPLSSKIRRLTFALSKKGVTRKPGTLEAQADLINAAYTLREQHASDRILLMRNTMRLNLQTSAQALAAGDRETIIAELADAAMMGYRHFRDLSPLDPTLLSAVDAVFLRNVQNPESLVQPTLDRLKQLDKDPQAASYYKLAIEAWLTRR